jgi:hypothetical protein
MLRLFASRRFLFVALGLAAVAGIAFGAFRLGSAAGADQTPFPRAVEVASTTGAPADPVVPEAPGGASAPSSPAPSTPLTIDEAKTIAVEAAGGGQVVEWDQDSEPTGLQFDVTVLLADGTSTDVTVDATTGQVVSIKHDADQWALD